MNFPWRRRTDREQDLDRELRAHLELEAEELGDHYAAKRALGNTTLIKELTREIWGRTTIDTLLQDLRYALRAMWRSPALTAVVVLSLALGIGANTAIFSLIDSVMLKVLPVSHPEELLQVTRKTYLESFSNPVWEQVRDRQDVFSGLFAYTARRFNLASGGEVRYVQGTFASGQYFETLGLQAALGRTFTSAEDQRGCAGVAVLSYDFWQQEFGGRSDILGKPILLDRHPFAIIGVTQPGFFGVDVGSASNITVPVCTEPIIRGEDTWLDERAARWLSVIGRPKPGIAPSQATARLKVLAPEIFKATLPGLRADRRAAYLADTFETLSVASGRSGLRSRYSQALLTLMVVVALVLVIACANVANLLLARGAVRQREMAVRMALGSGRARLIRQLLTESLLLSVCGAALGVLFAQWGARLLIGFLSSTQGFRIFLDVAIDARMLAFTAGVAILTGLLSGIAPAWRGTLVEPQTAMKTNSRGVIEGSKFGLSKMLVTAQVALSLMLVVGAALMLSTFWKLAAVDAGFDRDHVLLVGVDLRNANYPEERRHAGFAQMLERVRSIPGVRSASVSDKTPIGTGVWDSELVIDGYTAKSHQDVTVNFNRVGPRYFETMGTPFVAGRDFNEHDTRQSPIVAIVNQTFVKRYLGVSNPLGARFRVNNDVLSDPIEIVGVVKDSKYSSLREEIPPTAYRASGQNARPDAYINIELRSAGPAPADLIPAVKSAMEQVNSDITLQFTALAQQVDDSLVRERALATLSGFFGGLALLLATIGLYGVMSYNVTRRRNEIGIRIALGAKQTRVLGMVLMEVAVLVGIGLVVGLGAASATTRFLSSFLYGMKPNDPLTLGVAASVLAAVALVAGYLPARRASRLDPMTALRDE